MFKHTLIVTKTLTITNEAYEQLKVCIPMVFSPAGSHTSFIIATELNNRMSIVSSVAYRRGRHHFAKIKFLSHGQSRTT